MSPAAKGPISQRELLRTLLALVDTAKAKNSSMHKDRAKRALRTLLGDPDVNWRTPFIGHNLGARRCRYLASIGFWTDARWRIGGWTGPVQESADD